MNTYLQSVRFAESDAKKKGIPREVTAKLKHPFGINGNIRIRYLKDNAFCTPTINMTPGKGNNDTEVYIRLADIPKLIAALEKFIPKKK